MTAEKIQAGVKLGLADFVARGWRAQDCFINPDETAVPTVERCLADHVYDCVVIGAGLHLLPSRLVLFEEVVNAVHRSALQAAITFNTRPEDCVRQPRVGSDTRISRPVSSRTVYIRLSTC